MKLVNQRDQTDRLTETDRLSSQIINVNEMSPLT